ncbi:hypothetical protein DFJ58DRAFT_411380 [Suillus subalutaceus]|uniref:uncharacterized protein n=1 Tax=Suillus subalutaceus TaxID=48586 RepID=UPI001B8765D1|nr:uncharacterized protein DFJ58DRAFT_411380 [Suillus subalutaceus]KAG1852431.1 hypothetical protein DFJ58DRAFT_411380 [Suillus subalutaceus]
MVRECNACRESSNLKRCSGCHKVWYCSVTCQKSHWVRHIFACKPRRPITTADHLALAVRNNDLPQDPQTCEDYGFDRAFTVENRCNLLGLYIGLMDPNRIGITPKTIDDWRVRGVLVEEIKAAYYKIPTESRGGYFPWFLQNQHTLNPSAAGDSQLNDEGDAMVLRAWRFTGGAETDSPADIKARLISMPHDRQTCHVFYALLLSRLFPAPIDNLWIPFGFCSCACEEEEMYLSTRYQALIAKCTFDEFCDAFSSARILDLFRKNGIVVDVRYLADVLQNHDMHKSVWDLKQFAIQTNEQNPEGRMVNSVACDYGFMNCRKDAEVQALKKVYRSFFERHDADPLALHDAAIRGNIFGYLGSLIKLNRKYERLMKNPYPLPVLE